MKTSIGIVLSAVLLALLETVAAAQAAPDEPFGFLDGLLQDPGGIRVVGWAIDPDTTSAIEVHVYVDGAFAGAAIANRYRPDVGAAFRGFGNYHGYDLVVPRANALGHEVCAYGINVGAPGANRVLGCDFGPSYSTQITVFDFAGNTTLTKAVDMIGAVFGGEPFPLETATTGGSTVSFSNAASLPFGTIGLRVREASNPSFPGPLFRSGLLSTLPVGAPANPEGGIDILVAPAIPLGANKVSDLAATAVPRGMTFPTDFGPITVILPGAPLVILDTDTLTLVLPAIVMLPPALGSQAIAMSYSLALSVTPATSMDPAKVVVLAAKGSGALNIPGAEFAGRVLEPLLTGQVVAALNTNLNDVILRRVPAALCMSSLPAGVTLSVRRVQITKSGLAFSMALGAFGSGLIRTLLPALSNPPPGCAFLTL